MQRYAGAGGRMVQATERAGKRKRAARAGSAKERNVAQRTKMERGTSGGQVGVKRQIEVGAATIQRTVRGRYEWRDGQLGQGGATDAARAQRLRGADYDDGG